MAGLDNPVPPQPSSERDLLETSKQLVKSSESIRDILFALMEVLDQYPPSVITDANTGMQYNALAQAFGFVTLPKPISPSWPYKAYQTSTGGTGQIQINGGDGFTPTLNGIVANVSGSPADTPLSGPPDVYPQLSVTGNGVIYGYVVPNTAGDPTSFASFDIFYAGTIPSVDTANPATFYPFLIATITDYVIDGMGNVFFTINNATNYGWTTLIYCGGSIQVY